jgi:hypothetical protein
MEKFNLKELNDGVKISNMFAALENVNDGDDCMDSNRASKSIVDNMKGV